ncbi:MAG: hypothetical protein S4CHLAM45_00250 [Chlamydiales bacterium]|nr:hypothetical protein [Chlamydiales bacterium]MCH9619350.1 hypothetical protein [Chlamydiales bacterium]MCH9622154.1 hypothetical protein [Chlamydiales bacterium]
MKPKLSVCLINYNYEQYLPQCIESVLNQTFSDFEFVILDDCSTDRSVEIIDRYRKQDQRIRFFQNKENQGVIRSANQAFRRSEGEYYHAMASDDFRLPGFLKKTMDALLSNPSVGICCSDNLNCHEPKPNEITKVKLLESQTTVCLSPEEASEAMMRRNFSIPGHTSIIKRQYLEELGGYDEKLKHFTDWFLLLCIAFRYGVIYLPEGLSVIRYHKKNFSTAQFSDKSVMKETTEAVLNKVEEQSIAVQKRFFQSGSLASLYEHCSSKLCWSPKYWPYYFYTKRKKKFLRRYNNNSNISHFKI